jgi:hypothetical protein
MIDQFYDNCNEAKNKKHLYKALAIALLKDDICLFEFEDILIINTIVQYKNEYYALMQEAYIDGSSDEPHYTASAICLTGENIGQLCKIYWEIILDEKARKKCEDESEMCDWNNPSKVRFI